jgi:hypothetical protein
LHYALTDADLFFNTFKGKESAFTTADTLGCSCKQIIALSGLGPLAGKFGCNQQVMQVFIAALHAAPSDPGQQFPATGQTTCWDPTDTTHPFDTIPCPGTGYDGDLQAGATLSYRDNSNGTITDNNTGLMWEKLCYEEPMPGTTCPAEHHMLTTYTWEEAFEKIAALNTTPCFAGHCDWRLPNVKELQSIVHYQILDSDPAVSAEFHDDNCNSSTSCSVETCSCTAGGFYWSSTSTAPFPVLAWTVDFGDGRVLAVDKSNMQHVRAVRGGQ